jgi:hypothetical protein
MKGLFYLLSILGVMGLAFWAYQENYRTQSTLRESIGIKGEIGALRETLATLEAEWAYLNRPERLARLAELNFDDLALLPLTPEQFSSVEQVTFPPSPLMMVTTPIEISGTLQSGAQFP